MATPEHGPITLQPVICIFRLRNCGLFYAHPLAYPVVADGVEQQPRAPVEVGIILFELFFGLFYRRAAGGGEGDDALALQVVALDEVVDDVRGNVPPNGVADIYGVVLVEVFEALDKGGRDLGSCISTDEREVESRQSRSASV